MAATASKGNAVIGALPVIVERTDIHGVEPFANAKQEDADDDEGDQDREGDADLDDQRHSLGARGGEDQPVLQRHEPDNLADGISAGDHHQQPEQDNGQREGQILACQRIGIGSDPQHQDHGQGHQTYSGEHGRTDANGGLDVAMDAQPLNDPVKPDGNDDRLENEGDGRRDVEMVGVLNVCLPSHGKGKHDRMKRKNVDQRKEAVLIEHHEADQDQAASEQMGDVEGEAAAHQRLRETNSKSVPSRASMSAAPRKSGTRKTRILAMAVSNRASRMPQTASLPT